VSSDIVIRVDNVSKAYTIWSSPSARLHGPILGQVGQMPFLPRGLRDWCGQHSRQSFKDFYALTGVSLEIRRGESYGIIGRNGSGKSTLLQIIAGTLMPTKGEVTVHGSVAALLELGSGFNPEFTGRENVYMNAAIRGMTKEQTDARFDEIAGFADIGDFIDQPTKTYSSGMLVRLAFAVTTSVDADVLLIDEALAVGDVFFRQKCYKHLENLRNRGVTIVLVSHGMGEVEQFCQRAALLHHGAVTFHGNATEAVKRYYLTEQDDHTRNVSIGAKDAEGAEPIAMETVADFFWPAASAFIDISGIPQISNGAARCTGVALCDNEGRPCRSFAQGETASFFYEYELLQDTGAPMAGVELVNDKSTIVHGKTTLEYGSEVPTALARGTRLQFRQDITLELAVGEYTFSLGLGMLTEHDYQMRGTFAHAELDSKMVRLCILPGVGQFAITFRRAGKPVQLLHHGVANLPGTSRIVVTTNRALRLAESLPVAIGGDGP
jgi:lipopolysaccharide transport system ATP-binding protein